MLIVIGNSTWSLHFSRRIVSKLNSKRLRCNISTGGSVCSDWRLIASTYSPVASILYLLSPSSTSPSHACASPSRTDRFPFTSTDTV